TFVAVRTHITEPILTALYEHCQKERNTVLPKSKYGEALDYCINQWERLIAYRTHPWCRPDNNFVERIIRHFVVGRKNWLFANTVSGAWASALLYSLVQTAKVNNKEPYKYLCTLFTQLPDAQSDNELYSLLPHRIAL
ncbi:MAG: transposase, partial [Spirochaetota bacterium]